MTNGPDLKSCPMSRKEQVLLAAASLLFLLLFVEWVPWLPCFGLDGSWGQMLTHAHVSGLQFGPEFVFTYGPWGFLQASTHPQTFLVSLALKSMVALVLAAAVCATLRGRPLRQQIGWLLFFVVAANWGFHDERYFAFPLLALLLSVEPPTRARHGLLLLLAATSGFLGLVKFTYVVHAIVLFTLADALRWLRFRCWPILLPACLCSFVAFWMLAGQHLQNLPQFLASSWSVASGFSEAMSTWGDNNQIALYLGVVGVLLLAFWSATADQPFAIRGILVAGVAAHLFWHFKAGFVRHDVHAMHAFSGLLVTIALVGTTLWRNPPRWVRLNECLRWGTLASLGVLVWLHTLYYVTGPVHVLLDAPRQVFQNVLGICDLATGKTMAVIRERQQQLTQVVVSPEVGASTRFRADVAEMDRSAGKAGQAPALSSQGKTEDYYPWDESGAFLGGKRLQTRPVFESYLAYTPLLIRQNVDFLRSARAPDIVHFDICTIDGHFPALDDGASWPELLSRYELTDSRGGYLRLEKRAQPHAISLQELSSAVVPANEWIDLPGANVDILWAKMKFTPTLTGRLGSFLFKTPLVALTIEMTDGSQSEFRLIPSMASEGFVLGPVITNRQDFAVLALAPESFRNRRDCFPKRILIRLGRLARLVYRETVRFEVSRLEIAAAATPSPGGAPDRLSLWEGIAKGYADRGDYQGAALAYEKVVELAPAAVEGWIHLCDARLHTGQMAEARKAAETAYALAPADTNTFFRSVRPAGALPGTNSPVLIFNLH